jgi:hypothetical protein
MNMCAKLALTLILSGFLVCSSEANGCNSNRMKATDRGFIFKVVGGSDNIEAKTVPGKRTQLAPWRRSGLGGGPDILAWDDRDSLRKLLDSGDLKLGPPVYREDLQSALKRERARRPYPVLSSMLEKLRGTVDKQVFNVLLPAELQPDAKVVTEPDAGSASDGPEAITQKLDKAMTSVTVTVAFDTTGSMESAAAEMARQIKRVAAELPPNIQDAILDRLCFLPG